MAGNLRSGTESQPPIEAIKHLVTEHIAYHLFCRGSSLIGSDGFFCFTKQADVKSSTTALLESTVDYKVPTLISVGSFDGIKMSKTIKVEVPVSEKMEVSR